MVRPTTQTVASSNYMAEETNKAERSAIPVDLLVVEVIWIDQWSKVNLSTIAKTTRSQAAIEKYTQSQRAAAA